ncbi:Lanthionine synthetase C-like protein [Marininema mesophilum]|uniref:Lanthionine synthetase C-like protein n=1 Tax=Marininema mesophilum TaxID=1048340 RepID=A0A1H3AHX9_9BACL|nr:lanthionine synthetase C family protein [Marininema mesophilum]SDX29223.1 Lanthionine synthetase C-like protein [Marininema mesophilum]
MENKVIHRRRVRSAIADKGLEISQRIAERLVDPIQIKEIVERPDNVSVMGATPWGDTSLSHGYPATVLFFSQWDRYEPDQKWDYKGHAHIVEMQRALESNGIGSISLFGGLTGVAFACQAASREGERYGNFLKVIHSKIAQETKRFIEGDNTRRKSEVGLSPKVYDVISGLSGIGRYALNHPHHDELNDVLEQTLHHLVEVSHDIEVDHHTVPGWYIPQQYQFMEREKELFPKGNFNCGLAHGIPGPLVLLSLASLRGYRVDGQLEAIQRMSDWLVKRAYQDRYGVLWSDRIRFEEEVSRKPSQKYFSREAWCYGAPGVARSLYLAGMALGDEELKKLAIQAVKSSFMRPEELSKLESATFCHGKSGILQILLRMAKDTGEEIFVKHAELMAKEIIDMFQGESPFGYQDLEGGRGLNKAGLLEGVSGIGLSLMSLSEKQDADWDAAFLIS